MKKPDDTAPQNIQNVTEGASATQINHPHAPVLVGGEGNTYTFNYGVPAPPQRTPSGVPHNMPHRGTLHFVGRDEDLETLHQQLQTANTIAISAIAGMGGIGKTELALQYALKHLGLEDYPGGVCWLRAREDVGLQIVAFARSYLDLSVPEDLELGQQVAWCWQHWPEKTTLIVLDDVQKLEALQAFLPPVRSYFKVLLTSRSRFGSPVQNYEIKVLSEAAALELLRKLVPDGRIDQDLATAKQVCEWLGYLPLGLELVGRYLTRKPGTSIATLWQRLQDKRLAAKALLEAKSGMTASLGVTAAFELSWQELDGNAQAIAAVLSLFALAEIPWPLVQACLPEVDEEDLEDLRDEQLMNLSLLNAKGEGVYQLHQLLRDFFAVKRSRMAADEEMKRSFCSVMIKIAEQIPQTITLETIKAVAPVILHLREAIATLHPWLTDEELGEPAHRVGWFYAGQLAFKEAEEWYRRCLSISEQRLGSDHPNVAESLSNWGSLYYSQGQYKKAEQLHLKSLSIRLRQLGELHPLVANNLNNLAVLYDAQGQYKQAEEFYLRAISIRRQLFGEGHLSVAQGLNNLASLYVSKEQYEEAERLYMKSLAIKKRLVGDDHPDVAVSLRGLANLYLHQGQFEKAEPLLMQSLKINQQQFGEDHPDVAVSLCSLANFYSNLGCFKKAERFYFQSLSILQQYLGEEHPHVATILNNIANSYLVQGKLEKAEPLLVRSLEIKQRLLGEENPDVATSLNSLALLYLSQERYQEAEPLFLKALAICSKKLDADHSETRFIKHNLKSLVDRMIRLNRSHELSNDPVTQSLLKQQKSKKLTRPSKRSQPPARGFGKRS